MADEKNQGPVPSRRVSLPDGVAAQLQALLAMLAEGDVAHDRGRLEQRIALCRRILSALSRLGHAYPWAAVQLVLGVALARLGAPTGDAAVPHAAEACRAALEIPTRECAPTECAMTKNNPANLLAPLGGLTPRTQRCYVCWMMLPC